MHTRYLGLATTKKTIGLYFLTNSCNSGFYHTIPIEQDIIQFLKDYQQQWNCKIIMCGLAKGSLSDLHVKLWKILDILTGSVFVKGTLEEKACSAARKCYDWSTHDIIPGIPPICVGKNHRVAVDCKFKIAELENYKSFCDNDIWDSICHLTKSITEEKKSIVFFNSTPLGGGVAIIRHSMIRFLKLLDIDARWFVMKPNPKIFEITKKKIHNVLQGICNTPLTIDDKKSFKEWSESNVTENWNETLNADVIVIDDPQPSGMIHLLKQKNPNSKFIYRSHTQLRSDLIDQKGTVQYDTWNFLWENIKMCDVFITHPIEEFIPKNVYDSSLKIIKLPACTDPIDGLNKNIDSFSKEYYKKLFNKISQEQIGKSVDFSKEYFIQVARFDPSKGIPDLIKAYALFRENNKNDIQLIITGHGSIDDPEGTVIYKQVIQQISRLPKYISKDIFAVLLPNHDQLLNIILKCSLLAFQLSIREGFEIKVSEAMLKGIPVIAYKTGGIPLQITNGFDGFLVSTDNYIKVSNLMNRLVNDPYLLQQMSKNAIEKNRNWILTPTCTFKYLQLMTN